ncbi:MAG: hypothetical protein K5912_04310 [Alphaproteobacteria bacterium]|nr:hypothetical protein [Alphaproteobacteria bacterium]
MKSESGRSLIEIIGVLAITAVMTASAIAIYNSVRRNQANAIATAELREIAKNTKLLMGMNNDYTGISVDYLIKAGALKNNKPPVGTSWSVEVGPQENTFVIKLKGLTGGECDFFSAALPAWATDIIVNGHSFQENANCFTMSDNEVSFIVE